MAGHFPVFIRTGSHGLPYSKGMMSQSLTAIGIPPERAYGIAQTLQEKLRAAGERELSVAELHERMIELLRVEEGDQAAARFRRWTILKRKDIPIILLIGGTTGSGKSSVAGQVAHRLGINRLTSSDMIRQVMRAFFSHDLMPVLHHSSFDVPFAGQLLPDSTTDLGILGFIEQARQVSVGAQAVIERAERERMSTVVEGVHMVPGLIQHLDLTRCAVVEVVLFIKDEDTHRSHFTMRALQTDGARPMDNYLRNFDRIRQIQDYLVLQANRRGVPVIENTYMDQTVASLIDHTLDVVERVATEIDRTAFASEIAASESVPPEAIVDQL